MCIGCEAQRSEGEANFEKEIILARDYIAAGLAKDKKEAEAEVVAGEMASLVIGLANQVAAVVAVEAEAEAEAEAAASRPAKMLKPSLACSTAQATEVVPVPSPPALVSADRKNEEEKPAPPRPPEENGSLVGRQIYKVFKGHGRFLGNIISFDQEEQYYKIVYPQAPMAPSRSAAIKNVASTLRITTKRSFFRMRCCRCWWMRPRVSTTSSGRRRLNPSHATRSVP
ncbi:MAG: hypothetical protein CMA10_04725 [Euryarchaeota archaeon]|nr:hypothetical protein [Euryarchaeota archaeon]